MFTPVSHSSPFKIATERRKSRTSVFHHAQSAGRRGKTVAFCGLSHRCPEEFCNENDPHLASVTNLEIHRYIQSEVKTDKDKWTLFWIGGTDQETEGTWKWTDGSAWNFTQWATSPRQPNNFWEGDDCLRLWHLNAKVRWYDEDCKIEHKFVCSQRLCKDVNNGTSTGNTNDVAPDFPALAVALPSGIILFVIVLITVACAVGKCSKKKEAKVKVDENMVYGVYQLGEEYERHEIVDSNLYYEQ